MTSRFSTFSKKSSSISWPLREWLLMGAAAPLLLFPGRWSLGGLFLICMAWIVRRRRAGIWRITTPADPAIALILLSALVGVIISVDSALSLNRATVLLFGWFLYESTVVTVTIVGLDRRLLALVGLMGLLLAAMSLTMTDWQAGLLIPIPWLYDQLPQINLNLPGSGVPHSGGLFNPRTVAGGAILLWPINGVLALSGGWLPIWQRLVHALAALLLISVILLTQSPQALLAVGAACCLFLLALVGKWGRVGLLLLTLMASVVGFMQVGQQLSDIFLASLLDGRAGFGLVARLELWARAIRMIGSAPLTGIGLNNYAPVMDAFYPGYLLGPEAHAHNLILQTMTDQGILGLLGLLLFVGVTLRTVIKVHRPRLKEGGSEGARGRGGEGAKRQRHSSPRRLTLSPPRTLSDAPSQMPSRSIALSLLVAVAATIVGWLLYGLFEVLSLGHKPGLLLWFLFALPMALIQHKGLTVRVRGLWAFTVLCVLLTGIISWQTGGWRLNLATITAQQALSEEASQQPNSTLALQQLDLAEKQLGQEPQITRLRALLQVKNEQPEAAARSFRELVALELREPLWWWAPAPVLSGDLPRGIRGRVLIYRNWHTRFPDRVEPIALLAYTYADGMGGHEQAIAFLQQKLKEKQGEPSVLRAILADLMDK